LPTPPFWLTSPRILPMAIQTKGKGSSRIGACTVENHANLWKVFFGKGGENTANSCSARGLSQTRKRTAGKLQKRRSVENFRDFGGITNKKSTNISLALI